jgi:hypothetical protein
VRQISPLSRPTAQRGHVQSTRGRGCRRQNRPPQSPATSAWWPACGTCREGAADRRAGAGVPRQEPAHRPALRRRRVRAGRRGLPVRAARGHRRPVGPAAAIDGLRGWLERCRTPIEAKEAKPGQENLHQPFPGFSADASFGAQLVFDDALVREMIDRQLRALAKTDVKVAIAEGAALYADAARSLAETGRCRVILCARPDEIREHEPEQPAPGGEGPDSEGEPGETEIGRDFHDMLKAQTLALPCPLQVMRRETWEGTVRRGDAPRPLQDEASRAWNLHIALY